jgi:hypothetical protein
MLRIAAYLLVVGASLGCLGHLSRDIERALAAVGLVLLVASFLAAALASPGVGRAASRRARFAPLLVAIAAGVASLVPHGLIWFAAGVLGACALWLRSARPALRLECATFALATLVVAVGAEIIRILPIAWHLEMAIAATYSKLAAWMAREPRNLGPTAMALPLLGATLALAAARAALGAPVVRPRTWWLVVALVAAQLVYLLLLTPLAAWMARHRPGWQSLLLNSQWLALAVGAVTFAAADAIARRRTRAAASNDTRAAPSATVDWRRVVMQPRVVAGAVLGLALGFIAGRAAPPPAAPARVLLYDAGYTNFKIPQHGEYGERSGGMFGLLPYLLQAAGHEVRISKDLTQLEGPNAPQVVALINIQEFLDAADKERLLRFVRGGGGLLGMGDHTGVAGIRGPFNDLLEPLGMRLLFDSATFFGEGWSSALALRNHPLNRGVRDGENYQIWVGASLELAPNAAPVAVAKYGYSDFGDMSNLRMAFLGDRRYNPSELLGDVVLVGESRLGAGKVLMFGDTSTYQNLALARSWDVVLRSIDHLARRGGAGLGARAQWVLLLAFVAALGIVTAAGRRVAPLVATAAGLWTAAAVLGAPRAPAHALDWSRVRATSLAAASEVLPTRLAIIDRSHGGRYDLRAWFDPSVGGLMLNLIRDGFFPIIADEFPAAALERADLFVTIAPMRGYSNGERAALRRFLERGGRLLACVGYDELDGARSLLADHGLEVLDVPLSHFRTGERSEDLVFRNAWALRAPPDARVLVRQWGHPVVVGRTVGRGELVLIGDTTYFWNRNLEGREQWFLGNIHFLSALGRGLPIAPIEGRFGDPREALAGVADVPARPAGAFAAGAAPAQPGMVPRPQQAAPLPAAPMQPHVHAPGAQAVPQQAPHVHAPQQPAGQPVHQHGQPPQPHVHPPQPHVHSPQPHVHPPAQTPAQPAPSPSPRPPAGNAP